MQAEVRLASRDVLILKRRAAILVQERECGGDHSYKPTLRTDPLSQSGFFRVATIRKLIPTEDRRRRTHALADHRHASAHAFRITITLHCEFSRPTAVDFAQSSEVNLIRASHLFSSR